VLRRYRGGVFRDKGVGRRRQLESVGRCLCDDACVASQKLGT
jgi:hypothetical protein